MKIRLIITYIFTIFIALTYAQTPGDSLKIFKEHSMQFRTHNLLSLGSFKGSLLSYKYHPEDDYAYRVGISLVARKSKESQEIDLLSSSNERGIDHDFSRNGINIQLLIEYLKYFKVEEEIKMFVGVGPSIFINYNNTYTDNVNSTNINYDKKNKNNHYEIGISASYGLEWFFKDNMSLHAEYGFNFSYYYDEYHRTKILKYDDRPDGVDIYSNDRSGFEFDDNGALLGLSLYF